MSLRRTLIVGTAWMVAMRWAIKGIGLISTVILARLLTPADFGLIAMAALTIGMAEIFLSFGVDMALIQRQSRNRQDYDSAWTLRILQGSAAALLVVLTIPIWAIYFEEPRLEPVLWALAAGLTIGSFSNIGTVLFRADLQFDREFRFEVAKKVFAFTATICAALLLRNYWALVAGSIVGTVLGVIFSYTAHPYRPRICFSAIPRLWSFSQWMLVTNIGYYAESRADEIIVGGTATTAQMGFYSIGSEIGALPTAELAMPVSRALIPGYAKLQNEHERLNAAFLNSIGMLAILAFPAGFGLALIAPEAIGIMLGEKWLPVVVLVQILAFHGSVRICYGSIANLFVAIGQIRTVAFMTWLGMISFALAAVAAIENHGLAGVAAAKLIVNIFLLGVGIIGLWYYRGITPILLFERLYRPIIAAFAMTIALLIFPFTSHAEVALVLASKIALGSVTYSAALCALWLAAGRPYGAETFLAERVAKILRPAA